jgi:hypothetical protein
MTPLVQGDRASPRDCLEADNRIVRRPKSLVEADA